MGALSVLCAAALVIACAGLAIGIIALGSGGPKVAYVRSADLIYGYAGMKEAQTSFKQKTELWRSNVDTLTSAFESAVNAYNSEARQLSDNERRSREAELRERETGMARYAQAIQEKVRTEDQEMTNAVLGQINSFIEDYGRRNGYDVILGTTQEGNLLYGLEALDVTADVLQELNAAYLTGETYATQ